MVMPILHSVVARIQSMVPGDFKPKLGMIIGSGLGALAEKIDSVARIPYNELAGFFVSTVPGHAGELILGYLHGIPVACFNGRVHFYEGASSKQIQLPIYTMRELGCQDLIITNASGSLRTEVGPGSIVMINDLINFTGINPLVGDNIADMGPRFVGMENAFDKDLRKRMHQVAKEKAILLTEGVYIGVMGPCYETPAEIRAFKVLGADVVGMSTAPEVIIARHCGLRIITLAAITNFASGLSDTPVHHDEVIHFGKMISKNMIGLVCGFLKRMSNE